MTTVVRVVLLLLLAALLVGALVGIFAATTGVLEKLVFAVVACLIMFAGTRVQRIGGPRVP
jgi:flagellar biosynthesis protein FliQ